MFHLNDKLLEKLIDGSARGSEVQRIRRHAEACPVCARRLEEWRDNYAEVDQHFPELALESGPAPTVTPAGLLLLPGEDVSKRREFDLSTALWIGVVVLALVVGYGAHRLRQRSEGMAIVTREALPPRSGVAAGVPDAPVAAPPAAAESAAPERVPAPSPPPTRTAARPDSPPRSAPAARPSPAPGPSLSVSPRFRAARASEASQRLGGRLRLLNGIEPDHLEIGPASAVPGAQRGLDVVRVVYRTADGGRILVDQQLIPADSTGLRPIDDPTLESGETAYGTSPDGVSVATWLDEEGYRISVVVQAPVDSLRRLVSRIQ